jgi:hypothetical protein
VPDQVTGVAASGGNQSASVSWLPAGSEGSSVLSYEVTATGSGGQSCTYIVVTHETDTCTVTGLANTSYTFTVTATNADGTSIPSAASNAVTPTTAPGAVTGVSAVAGYQMATVSWSAPSLNGGLAISGYTVTANDTTTAANGGQTCSVTATSCTFTGLTNGDHYELAVTATNADGAGAGASASTSPSGSDANITSPDAATVLPGASVNIVVTATAPAVPTRTSSAWLSATGLPAGLTFNPGTASKANSAIIKGTAPAIGVYTVELVASNIPATETVQRFTLTVLGFTSTTTTATFVALSHGSASVITSDPGATLTTTSVLPSGVTLASSDGSATLAGTPTTGRARAFAINIVATDGTRRVSQVFNLKVNQAPALSVATASTTLKAGKAVSIGLTTTGFPAPTVTLSGGAPSWVSATSSKITGTTPATGGSWTFTVSASNGIGSVASQVVTIHALAIASATTASFTHGYAGTFSVTTAGAPSGTVLTAMGLPADGLSFTDNGNGTATISGMPTSALSRPISVTITATSGSVVVTQTLKISVS